MDWQGIPCKVERVCQAVQFVEKLKKIKLTSNIKLDLPFVSTTFAVNLLVVKCAVTTSNSAASIRVTLANRQPTLGDLQGIYLVENTRSPLVAFRF